MFRHRPRTARKWRAWCRAATCICVKALATGPGTAWCGVPVCPPAIPLSRGLQRCLDHGPALRQLSLVGLQLIADQRDDDLVLVVEGHLHGDIGEDLRGVLVHLVAPDMVRRLGL